LSRGGDAERDELLENGSLTVAAHDGGARESVLYTTLEPCPMCTVAILNAGLQRVVIAAEDPPAGTLAPVRLAGLPPIWRELAQHLEVVWVQSTDPSARLSYVPAQLHRELLDTFLDSRRALDEQLAGTGVLDTRALLEVTS
jgi:hypothetical protein